MSNKKSSTSFLVQGSILAMASIISRIIGLVYRIPLTAIIGNKGNDYYGCAFEIYNILLIISSYSLPLAVSKLVSADMSLGRKKNVYRILKCALIFGLVSGTIAALILFFGAEFITGTIMKTPYSIFAVKVLVPTLIVVAVLGVMRGFFQGLGTMMPSAVSQILEQIINAVVSIGGAYVLLKAGRAVGKTRGDSSYGEAYGAAGGTLGTVAGAAAALVFVVLIFLVYQRVEKKKMKKDRSRHKETYEEIFRVLLLTIAPVILSATVYNICGVIDNAMFGKIMAAQGHKESEYAALLGIISGKYDTLINVPLAFSSAIASAMMPSIVAAVKNRSRKQLHNKIELFSRFTMVVALPSAVGFIVLAKPLLDLIFFTEDNRIAAVTLQFGALSVIFYCLSTITNAALQGMDRMMTPVYSAAAALVVHIISLFIMMVVFKWGIYAVVLSKIVFSVTACIFNAHALREYAGFVQERKKTFIIPAIASVIMGVVALVVHLFFELFLGKHIATILALLAAVAVYGTAIILLGGLTEAEMRQMPMGTKLVAVCKKCRLFPS